MGQAIYLYKNGALKMNLKYYVDENKRYMGLKEIYLSNNLAKYIFNKLKKKYGFNHNLRIGYLQKNNGSCSISKVKVCKNPDLLILIHEIAHAIQFKKLNYENPKYYRFHGKKHKKIIERIIKYTLKRFDKWKQEA